MRWPWTAPPRPIEQARTDPALLARVEELEDTAKRLERRFVKLQGEFSAYQRDYYADTVYDDEEDGIDDVDRAQGTRRRA
jgi:hypothetical protein